MSIIADFLETNGAESTGGDWTWRTTRILGLMAMEVIHGLGLSIA